MASVRLWAGLFAPLTGSEFVISGPRYVIGALLALTGGVPLGVMGWAERSRRRVLIAQVACPNCGMRTKRMRRLIRHRIMARILAARITRRNCERCGWNGLST